MNTLSVPLDYNGICLYNHPPISSKPIAQAEMIPQKLPETDKSNEIFEETTVQKKEVISVFDSFWSEGTTSKQSPKSTEGKKRKLESSKKKDKHRTEANKKANKKSKIDSKNDEIDGF